MPNYKDFQPKASSRKPEQTEWSIRYAYNAPDNDTPRALLIGDSICNGYHAFVGEKLAPEINLTYWASSKCVTDQNYLKELDLVFSSGSFDYICFNNGLHSLSMDLGEWEQAYRGVVKFIRASFPEANLFIIKSTPTREDAGNLDAVIALNEITRKVAADEKLPVIDLYTAMMEFGREHMCDQFHWHEEGRRKQAEVIAANIRALAE